MVLPLPIAGIMTNESAEKVGLAYSKLDKKAKEMGSKLSAPYMSLSFMALLVIPELKMSDKGLFDCQIFNFTNLKNTL
jgi:adenine deaminase